MKTNNPTRDRYLVVGNPIKHSQSPTIHTAFADSTQQVIDYSAQLVAEDNFENFVDGFFQQGGKGLNVTLPFKQRAFAMAQQVSDAARLAKAANTLWCNAQGQLCADNTDGVGLVKDIISNLQGTLTGKRILILGAGGAVRGVLAPILAQRPQILVIANRTVAKAQAIVDEVSANLCNKELASKSTVPTVLASGFGDVLGVFDWVINGTSASLTGRLPPLPQGVLAPQARTYDMMYGKEPTLFSRWAMDAGAVRADDGLGMLVEQAAESFFLWRQVRPKTQAVLANLRAGL